jgi:ABC-2 type transport system ATP-binding protein
LLDEPTSGLDPLIQQEFFRLVADVQAEGRTVFFSSHVLSEVERVCGRVAIIRQGRILRVSTVAELKTKELRHLAITFGGAVPDKLFSHIPCVREVAADGDCWRCVVQGPIDPVVKALAAYEVKDLICQEPSLEDVFLDFYSEDPHAT